MKKLEKSILRVFSAAMLIAAAFGCTSCGSSTNRAADTDSTAVEDSVDTPLQHLPDTAFASVDAISYEVECFDSVNPGTLDNLHDLYSSAPGIMTFRGGPLRDAPMTGSLASSPSKIEIVWRFKTSSDVKWGGGSGWTGQPVYVKWPQDRASKFLSNKVVNGNFRGEEIIVGSLDGNVYFIDPTSGQPTREKIIGGNPIKGSVSLDPTLNGYLYVGQGINNIRPFGALTINLLTNEIISAFDIDPKAGRAWGAYDSSPLRHAQFVFRPGENGTLYKWLPTADGITLHSALRYKVGGIAPGMEASISAWRNYGYISDNAGNVICVNLDTMKPVWHYDNHDDSDSSPVIIEEKGRPYIYTGSEIDRQGEGYAYYVKLDGLTGEKIWQLQIPGRSVELFKKHFDGGFYATPLPGRADCTGLLFANVVKNTDNQNGAIMAIDTNTGKIIWETPLMRYPWSSPVALTDKAGKMYIFTGDTAGNVYVINGKTGEILVTEHVGNNFESSPIVIGDEIYVGSRGDTIFKLKIS